MSEPSVEWTDDHVSLIKLLQEKQETLSDDVSSAVKIASSAKTLTPTIVHAIGRALNNTTSDSEKVKTELPCDLAFCN